MENGFSILCVIDLITELKSVGNFFIEYNSIRRASKLKSSKLLTLCEHIILFYYGDTARYFSHTDLDDRYFSNIRTKGVDDKDVSSRERG